MTDNEFLLFDRIEKIKSVFSQYGADNFYLSYSGGKDSVVLSHLLDMALPGNQIPRVFANTGIEYNLILDFVERERERDCRIQVIKSSVPIKPMLERDGYPFKSKMHAETLARYQKDYKKSKWVMIYLGEIEARYGKKKIGEYACPKCLRYQFTEDFTLKISDKCCDRLKKEPLEKWQQANNIPYALTGITSDEGGRRRSAACLAFSGNKLKRFNPLMPVTKAWEDWFIDTYHIEISDIYKPPYNFDRTGCKGCPFNPTLQRELDTLDKYFPLEKKQCEIIWRPVYEEYRRIGYRLRPLDEGRQMSLDEFLQD